MNLDLADSLTTETTNVEAVVAALGIAGVGAILFVQKIGKPIVAMALVVIGVVVGIGGVTFLRDTEEHHDVATGGNAPKDAAEGLCAALEQASGGDAAAAQATFTNSAHSGLHLIATDAEDVDRALAAELLEAKQKVEEDVFNQADAGRTERDLENLVDVTARAMEALGGEPPSCAG